MLTVIHTYTGPIYSGETTVELSGFATVVAAIASAEARCLDFGGSYEIIRREPIILVDLDGAPLAEAA